MKLWSLDKTKGYILKYRVPPLWPTYLIYKFTTSVRDGARVRNRQLTRPGPALPAGQSPIMEGAELGPSQKVDRARPGTPHGYDKARRNSCTLYNFCSREHPLREVISNHFSESFSGPLPMIPHFTWSRIFILHMGLWPATDFMGDFSKTIN